MNTSELAFIAIQAALKAGDILSRGFKGSLTVATKTEYHDVVTEYDKAAEEAVISTIKQRFPTHRFIAEESGGVFESDQEIIWVIDPLDGTLNFVHGLPLFCVSIGAYAQGTMQVGVIYLPILHELFVAEKGHGAYLNGAPISVSKTANLQHAVCMTGFPHRLLDRTAQNIARFNKAFDLGNPIRDLGSAAIHLAYVAAGRADLFWIARLHPWDVAAGKLLVEEAGGLVTHYDGTPHTIFNEGNLFASNKILHNPVLSYLKETKS